MGMNTYNKTCLQNSNIPTTQTHSEKPTKRLYKNDSNIESRLKY